MKIAISGKGGVGKTTLAAGLALFFANEGRRVVAIDADPDANLAVALGATPEAAAACVPLVQEDELIEERTGAAPGKGGMFILNPEVSDIVDRCGVTFNGVTMLKMGTVERGGSGCMCSEGTFLKAFMRDLLVDRDDVVILDMEAGIEHLGRGTAEAVDCLVVVIEPGGRSVQTAHQVRALAADIGIKDVVAVANRVQDAEDAMFVKDVLGDIPLLGTIPLSEGVRVADREGHPSFGTDPSVDEAVRDIAWALVERTTR